MRKPSTTMIAIGGGDIAAAPEVLDEIFNKVENKKDARLLLMTIATNEVEGAYEKYNSLFRKRNIKHIDMVDVSVREDAFSDHSIKKLEAADAVFFTGGDQLNITSLFGGTPLH